MNIIVPMAGRGKRLRPHTLVTPKPLLTVAGKSIVQRLVEDIAKRSPHPIANIAFITGRFGKETESSLLQIAESLGAKGHICYQDTPLGTAHAILCASEFLRGPLTVAFADTLFRADFTLETPHDGILWVKQIEDPSQFGVVRLNSDGIITEFVEKPATFVSDLAMIGIYYFKNGEQLHSELQYLIDHNIVKGGEYQLPDALTRLTSAGKKFVPGKVDAWLDFGNKCVTISSHAEVLRHTPIAELRTGNQKITNSTIIEPCFLGDGVEILNSIVGPYTSLGAGCKVTRAIVSNSLIQNQTKISNIVLDGAMVGTNARIQGHNWDASLGDYSEWTA